MMGLCDCNNFFASSERVFRPDLSECGIVVLSNNDGIIVAADKKAKSLGFKRGKCWFEVKDSAMDLNIKAFSSNYTLYQDLSNRVMNTLSSLCPEIEPYSIDEAFFSIPAEISAAKLREKVTNSTGIPVSIGYARTKTLVKAASKIAKEQRDFSFELKEEKLARVGSRWYAVMAAEYTGKAFEPEGRFCLLGLAQGLEGWQEYLKQQLVKLKKFSRGVAGDPALAGPVAALVEELEGLLKE